MSRWAWLGVIGLLLVPGPASASYIGIFMDPNASSCAANVGPNPRVDLHVVAVLEGDVPEMTGAQFMIAGTPASWTPENVLWVPDVGVAISLGNPVFITGIHSHTPGLNVAFSTCQGSGGASRVPLGRLILLGPPTADNVHLQVTRIDWKPSDPVCPFVTICDYPACSKACVGGGEIVLNGEPPANCQMAVEERTWTTVKSLYRN